MINDNQQQMGLTLASDWFFKSMKGALKRILEKKSYMNISNDDNISNEPIIKEEDAFHVTQKYKEKSKKLNPQT